MDEQASSSVECLANNNDGGDENEVQWRFSQIKGNIESDDAPTDG